MKRLRSDETLFTDPLFPYALLLEEKATTLSRTRSSRWCGLILTDHSLGIIYSEIIATPTLRLGSICISIWDPSFVREMVSIWDLPHRGGHFSKVPVTYRARKEILETMIRLPWKAALLIHYFPIVHNALCLPPKFCINYCCEILLGGLHIPKSIPQQ